MSTITDARRYPSGHCWSRKLRPPQADNMSPNPKNNRPLPNNNSRQCRRGDREQHFQQDETVDRQRPYKQQNIRPSYLRLDSCGENSSAGSGSDEMEVSPGLSSRDRKSPHSRQNSWSHRSRRYHRESQPELQASEMQQSRCVNGLFDRVRTMFSEFEKPHHQRSRTGMNFIRQEEHSADSRLADLDSVAAKFTNLSCDMMSGNQCNTYQNMDGAYPPKWINNQGYVNHHPQQRNPPPFFHPYFSENLYNQPSLISATQNYKRTYYQPWNPYMNRPGPFMDYSQRGFNNQCDHPGRWQHHPQFPRQPWLMPHVRMMQGQYNMEPGVHVLYPQERNRQPQFQKYQKHRRNSQRDKRKHSKRDVSQQNNNCSSHSSDNVQTAHSRSRAQSDSQKLEADQNGGVTITANSELPAASNYPQEAKVCGEPEDLKSAICAVATEQTSHCEQVQISEERESSNAETRAVEPSSNVSNASVPSSRHSSINLILADYESSSVLHPSEDSDFSDANSDLSFSADENVDLWDSFCVNDPYDPLRGWSCTPVSSTPSCLRQMSVESHVDSGTDEGDVLTDSEDEVDDSDNDLVDGSVEAGSASFHKSGLDQTGPLKLSMPQLQTACKNFSSTPKQASGATSPIHPSVAFILGSPASSGDEDEDDEEWDTLDDSCNLHDDLLWNSFHKARDPYSPMDAWKHKDSILSSTEQSLKTETSVPRTDEHHTSLCDVLKDVATAEKASSSSPNCAADETPTFEIPTVCLYSSKDDIDCPSGSPLPDGVGMKRTSSTSCLKKAQISPQLRAQKKVRFCADSSFIVLVEKDSPPVQASDSDPPDWQTCARDRMRFQSRIAEVARALDPVLAPAHRMQVFQSHFPPKEVSQT
ncbi:uncharacterized protein [Diadema antillarum]|uniref:uncharacterized protein n=1 Tax=Diadema antillarum TaxID=105358 RepID=UPI003A87E9B8